MKYHLIGVAWDGDGSIKLNRYAHISAHWWYVFSCPEQLNRWPCHSLSQSVTEFYFWHYRVTLETCDLWDICSEWLEDMTWPTNLQNKYKDKDNDKDTDKDILRTPPKSNPRDLDLWDICSEWWEDMTWPKNWQWKIQRQRQWQRQRHFENTS